MTLVMDGVRRTSSGAVALAMPAAVFAPVEKPRPKKIHKATARANSGVRYVTGMDGIRRAVPLTPREMLANVGAPAIAELEAVLPMPAPADMVLAAPRKVAWQRPVIAFGLVATSLLVSAFAVQALNMRAHNAGAKAQAAESAPAPVKSAPVVAATPAPQKAGLQELVNEFAAANPDKWGIVVKDLKTGQTASYNPDRQLTSASLYKLFVAQRIYQRIDIGQMDYGQAAGGGTGRNVEQCLTVMINISDNACGRALGSTLGWGAQNQALELEGYKQTNLAQPQQTSASDVARLLGRLYDGTLLSPSSTNRFMGLLKDQRVNNRLPQGLPAGTVIAHKTGDLDGYTHDAGIVYGPKTNYLVVVTSGAWGSPATAAPKFADLSSKLWNYFEN
jgi:beta-lactamase class A